MNRTASRTKRFIIAALPVLAVGLLLYAWQLLDGSSLGAVHASIGSTSGGSDDMLPATTPVTVGNHDCAPLSLRVLVGTAVTWRNESGDTIQISDAPFPGHVGDASVYLPMISDQTVAGARRKAVAPSLTAWISEPIDPGGAAARIYDEPGEYRFYISSMPAMTGSISVVTEPSQLTPEPTLSLTPHATLSPTAMPTTSLTPDPSPTATPSPTQTSTTPSPTPTWIPVTPLPTAVAPGLPPSTKDMVLIPAGEFKMGCVTSASSNCGPDELPLHTVYLDDYYIDKYEVTNNRYAACVDAGVCSPPDYVESSTRDPYYGNPAYGDYPVVNVDFYQAKAFCEWENKHLPSEAQWEKAARGSSDTRLYPWGMANASCAIANFRPGGSPEFCVGDTSQVGIYVAGASPYGVMDMAGNAFEWVMDWYRADYYKDSPYENPPGPTGGSGERVLRGGAWNYSGWHMRAAYRVKTNPDDGYYENGFRCARPPME